MIQPPVASTVQHVLWSWGQKILNIFDRRMTNAFFFETPPFHLKYPEKLTLLDHHQNPTKFVRLFTGRACRRVQVKERPPAS